MTKVVAIFDIGKTNKKLLLFDEQYQMVGEQTVQLSEIKDEDGDPCEDILTLREWIMDSFNKIKTSNEFELKALNVAAYGASFVHLDENGELLAPLYNYLKPYPGGLLDQFYSTFGGKVPFSIQTASPALGSLNSGLQLYRLKKEQPELFTRVHYSLHLPQYLAWLINAQPCSDITSIGCHTGLWDFLKRKYHNWVFAEGIAPKLPPIISSEKTFTVSLSGQSISVGVGLHDSSSALIPYLAQFREPFILLSTGTWNISLNPFNDAPLTSEELTQDCLCYLDYRGNPVKASRLFAGNEHEKQVRRLSEHYHVKTDHYKTIEFNAGTLTAIRHLPEQDNIQSKGNHSGIAFNQRDLFRFKTYEAAYHQLIVDLVSHQIISTQLVINNGNEVRRIFVDGGFSRNTIFMNLLASAFGDREVFAASVPHATALGAALAIHPHWNGGLQPADIIKLKRYEQE